MKYQKKDKIQINNYGKECEKAFEILSSSIIKAHEQYSIDILVSAMTEINMRLTLLKYGPLGIIALTADILHSTAISQDSSCNLGEVEKKSDFSVMESFKALKNNSSIN